MMAVRVIAGELTLTMTAGDSTATPSSQHRTRLGIQPVGQPHAPAPNARGMGQFGTGMQDQGSHIRRPPSYTNSNMSGRRGNGFGLSAGMRKGTQQGYENNSMYR